MGDDDSISLPGTAAQDAINSSEASYITNYPIAVSASGQTLLTAAQVEGGSPAAANYGYGAAPTFLGLPPTVTFGNTTVSTTTLLLLGAVLVVVLTLEERDGDEWDEEFE